MRRAIAALVLFFGAGIAVSAHPTASSFVVITITESRTAIVDITTDAESLRLKLEALGGGLLKHIALSTDRGSVALTSQQVNASANAGDARVRIRLTAPLPDLARTLAWQSSLFLGSYPVLIRGGDPSAPADADAYIWLNGSEASPAKPLHELNMRRDGFTRFMRTVGIGFTHILPGGLDHVLFVCGLFLLAGGFRTLLLQISAFTVAHTVTLATAALGLVSVPAVIVEPLIALSIAYVAVENLRARTLSRWRLAVVFGFGLLHGLGFAGALLDLGVSRPDLPMTLVGFNVGVELGQIAVVAIAAVVVRLVPVPVHEKRRWVTVPASVAIAAMGIFWALQRAAEFAIG